MTKWTPVLLLLWIVASFGCVDKEREAKLAAREAKLLEQERQFTLKEAEYQSLIRMRDSLLAVEEDTLIQEYWPVDVIGLWNSKVVCVESDCNNYVIGDVRSDQWEFGYDSTRLITKVSSNNKLVRVYEAAYRDSAVQLLFSTDSSAKKQVTMRIVIDNISSERMKGTRTVTVDNSCTAKFSVELTKNKNNPE